MVSQGECSAQSVWWQFRATSSVMVLPTLLTAVSVRHCRREPIVYYRIANHYKFILQQMFDCRQYERLIIVEDDMLFAPDFFPFFEATAKVLDQVSADQTSVGLPACLPARLFPACLPAYRPSCLPTCLPGAAERV